MRLIIFSLLLLYSQLSWAIFTPETREILHHFPRKMKPIPLAEQEKTQSRQEREGLIEHFSRKTPNPFDMSMAYPLQSERTSKQQVWLISYAGSSLPNDRSPKADAFFRNQNFLHSTAINKGITGSIQYGKQDLDATFYQNNKTILDKPRGAGYWLWKPYIILKTLNMIAENDILIYLDSGCCIKKDLRPLLQDLETHDMLVKHLELRNGPWTKRDLMILENVDTPAFRKKKTLEASFIAMQNTTFTKQLITKWMTMMKDPRKVTDTPSTKAKEYPFFKEHRHDQACLNVTVHTMQQERPHDCPVLAKSGADLDPYILHHRRRIAKKSLMTQLKP